jgi:hypothetical protein
MGRVDNGYGGVHSGVIINDPLRPDNHVLKLQEARSGGDIITLPSFNPPNGKLNIKLEFMGVDDGSGGSGAFIGLTCGPFGTGVWRAATYADPNYLGVSTFMISDNTWHTVEFQVTFPLDQYPTYCSPGQGVNVVFEDFSGSKNHVYGNDNFWDNIEISYELPPDGCINSRVHKSEVRLTKAQELAMQAEFASAQQPSPHRAQSHLLGMATAVVGFLAVVAALVALVVHIRRQPAVVRRDVESPQSPTIN